MPASPSFSPKVRYLLACLVVAAGSLLLAPRPLTAPLPERLEIADLTWVELRALVAAGWTTAIVPSGGLEQNGPHLAIGKHDRIVAVTAKRIAASLGRTLVTPVIPYVPQGAWDPPTGNMAFPGTIGVTPAAFEGTLEGIARSLKAAGFRLVCLVADHGESLPAQQAVASRLTAEWARDGIRVLSVDGYTADAAQRAYLKGEGETDESIGRHGGIQDTAELMAASPDGVRLDRWRDKPFLSEPTGADGDPGRATPERGRRLLDLKIEAAVAEIRKAAATQDPPSEWPLRVSRSE